MSDQVPLSWTLSALCGHPEVTRPAAPSTPPRTGPPCGLPSLHMCPRPASEQSACACSSRGEGFSDSLYRGNHSRSECQFSLVWTLRLAEARGQPRPPSTFGYLHGNHISCEARSLAHFIKCRVLQGGRTLSVHRNTQHAPSQHHGHATTHSISHTKPEIQSTLTRGPCLALLFS